MKIVVFGASGGVGLKVVEQALQAGHVVTAFVRTPSKFTLQYPHLILVQGDSTDAAAVEKAIAGQDAVISTLGPTRPPVPQMMEISARNIQVIRDSGLEWTIVRFPRLVDGPGTGKFRAGYVNRESSTQLSRADAAAFVLQELVEKKWVGRLPLASYYSFWVKSK